MSVSLLVVAAATGPSLVASVVVRHVVLLSFRRSLLTTSEASRNGRVVRDVRNGAEVCPIHKPSQLATPSPMMPKKYIFRMRA